MGDTEDIRGLVGRAAVISCLLDRIERPNIIPTIFKSSNSFTYYFCIHNVLHISFIDLMNFSCNRLF